MPTRAYTPEHKGKVESGVKYAQENAVKGRMFKTLEEQNEYLQSWECQVADQRIHGTTKQQVRKRFEEREKAKLLPLPPARFPCFTEAERKVHRDGHVEVQKSYYSVPPEYLGRTVWVRWDSHTVRVFNHRLEQIAIHSRAEPGRFSTQDRHMPKEKISGVEKGVEYLLRRASFIGPHIVRWAQSLVQTRGIPSLRVLQGFLALAGKNQRKRIERACQIAVTHEAYRLKDIRHLLASDTAEVQESFAETHPLIRDMAEYQDLVTSAFRNGKPQNQSKGDKSE